MWIEDLEQRALLSATLSGGVLTVTGTSGNDVIMIRTGKDDAGTAQIIVTEGVATRPHKGATRVAPTVTRFAAADVKSVVVNAGDGNDSVALTGRRKSPFAVNATINGGNGNDRLLAGAGNDTINGGAGNDRIEGGDGNDLLNGDDGNDRIAGGRGADSLNGGNGNDYLLAADRTGTDIVDGGANDPVTAPTTTTDANGKKHRVRGNPGDVAVVDTGDTVTNVEKTVTITRTVTTAKA
jgi:Ca2+-binding RTX toxin-like protein